MKTREYLVVWSFSEYCDDNIVVTVVPNEDYYRKDYQNRILNTVTITVPDRELIIQHGLSKYQEELANLGRQTSCVKEKMQNLLALPAPSALRECDGEVKINTPCDTDGPVAFDSESEIDD